MFQQHGYHLEYFQFSFIFIGSFIFKNKNFSLISKSLAPSGFVFNIIALVTGSIWGKPTWGTWWAWDARITSMLILALFYLMYLLAWRIYEDKEQVIKITSIIAILGAINVPIIKFSVDWWNHYIRVHQLIFYQNFNSSSMLFLYDNDCGIYSFFIA